MKTSEIFKSVAAILFIWSSLIWNISYALGQSGKGESALSSKGKRTFITAPFENKVFIEEQGQFKKSLDEKKISFPGKILYAVNNAEFEAYFTSTGITFLFSKTEKTDKEEEDQKDEADSKRPETRWEIVNMQWVNNNPNMHISAKEKESSYYTFGRYSDNSQYDHVSAFKKLYYSNIYEGVDAEFEFPENGGIKYRFIVRAGYNIPKITYSISGPKKFFIDEQGNLKMDGILGSLIDKAPSANTQSNSIPAKYILQGNHVEIAVSTNTPALSEDLIIDPWIIVPALPAPNIACDLQEDSIGNVYVNGGTSGVGNYEVQKYTSLGVLVWSHNYSCSYYGAIAAANSGSIYYSDGIPGKVTKLSSAGSVIYSVSEGQENWRLSFNRSKTILAMGGNFGASSLTKIDTATGVMGSTVSYPSDTWAIATDCNGDIYSLHYGTSPCILRKTNADFTPALSLVTTPAFCITGYSNVRAAASGYNAITISGPYLYIYDGLELRRFLKSTLTLVNSVSVPNGTANNCSGIAFDYCGNIYVGTMSTIEKYDMLLNPVSSIAAPNIVYDITLAGNGDLLVCGQSFVGNFGPTCPFPPHLAASAVSTNVSCKPGTAHILANGGTLPYSYLWQPGGQTTAAATNLTAGTYTYTVNDAFCQSHIDSVTVIQTTPLKIISDTNIITNADHLLHNPACFGFNNGSASVNVSGGTPPYRYSWNTSPPQANDTASGLRAGAYIVTVLDADSCSVRAHIILTEPAVLRASPSQTPISCFAGADGTATVTATGGTSPYTYSWNTSPVQTSAGAVNLALGSYTCTVTDSHACTADTSVTFSQPSLVFIDPIPADTICAGLSSTLTALAHGGNPGGYTYTWNPFHNGAVNTVSPMNTATYSITAMDSKSCLSAVQSVTVEVDQLPTALISGTASVCKNAPAPVITLTGSSSTAPYTFTYNINGGAVQTIVSTGNSVNITVPSGTAGTYPYTLLRVKDAGSRACSQPQSGSAVVVVHPLPIAKFGSTKVCQGVPTQFTDSSTTSAGIINFWNWDFGDGSSAGIFQNPSRLYAAAGMYNAALIVNNNFGCADTVAKPVQVYYNPVAEFTHVDVCFGDSLRFTNTSTVNPPASLSSYLWVFGDSGPTGSAFSPSHYYIQSGTYTVTLLSSTANGCSDASTHTVKAYDAPQSSFNKSNICLSGSEVFSNTTTTPLMGSTARWSWNFGDGSLADTSTWSPVHHYASPGIYHITLITRSSGLGCADTVKDSITVYPMPVAGFGFRNVCLNQPMNFYDSSSIAVGSIASHSWTFGDGTFPNGNTNPSHLYASPGSYHVSLIITSSFGCKDSIVKTAVVHPLPHALIAASDVCKGTVMLFNDSSFIATTDTIHSWRWNYSDSSPLGTTENTSHLYASSGSYPVQLFITSNFGCVDSVVKIMTVNPNPVPAFTSSDSAGCEPLCITFQNASAIASGVNTAMSWNFGDGSSSGTGLTPQHCYTNDSVFAPRIINVTLTVTSDSGCSSTKTKPHFITVYPAPVAGFTALPESTSIVNPVISLTDISTGADYWLWNFGGNDTTSIEHPLPHTYADTGTYKITLVTSTRYSCFDSIHHTIIIEPDFVFYIPNSFTPNDDGINDTFTGKGIFIKEYEMMIFDRWGNLIFYSDDINKGWDGTANHGTETSQRDTYVYSITVTDIKRQKHVYKGAVTLVR